MRIMPPGRKLTNVVLAWTTTLTTLLSWSWMVTQANADSLELRIDQASGLTKDLKGRTEYWLSVHECSPICTSIGYESLAEKTAAHLISPEGIRGKFRLCIKLHRRTRPPPQERGLIPVEVVERETLLPDSVDGEMDSGQPLFMRQSSFEPYGRVLISGSKIGEKGNLNHNWRETEELIAKYSIETTTSAVRRCRKWCRFHSESTFVQKVLSNTTVDTPSFQIHLTAFPESSREKATPSHLLLAAHFAEAIENSVKEDLMLPFEFPGDVDAMRKAPGLVGSDENSQCRKYRFVASIGEDIAYVWYLSKDNGDPLPLQKDHLNTGSDEGVTVIAFRDIEKSSNAFADTWGRNELSPITFTGASTYEHFESLGKVHSGFLKRYNKVAEELRTWVRPGAKVLVTGSYVGGAIACLAYTDWLSDSNMDVGQSYGVTFGAAQVGDKLFQKAFRELGRYEPSKAKLGYFEQVIAADEKTGRVDLRSQVPSALFEGVVPYPGIHSIDCLRSVLPIERTALSSPGHLRTFRSVGRRRYLYSGRRFGMRKAEGNVAEAKSSRSLNESVALDDMAKSVFILHGNVMGQYIERLYSIFYDVEEVRLSDGLRSRVQMQEMGDVKNGMRDWTCEETSDMRRSPQALVVDVEVWTRNEDKDTEKNTESEKSVTMQVCEACEKGNEKRCRPLQNDADEWNGGRGVVRRGGDKAGVSFVSLRGTGGGKCVLLESNRVYRAGTCGSSALPKERVRAARSEGIAVEEVVGCGRGQRCKMELDGVTMVIAAERREVFGEVGAGGAGREGGGRDGVLVREAGGGVVHGEGGGGGAEMVLRQGVVNVEDGDEERGLLARAHAHIGGWRAEEF